MRASLSIAFALGLLLSSSLHADSVSFSHTVSKIGAGIPEIEPPLDSDIHRFFVTTDADILSIHSIRITDSSGQPLDTLYHHALGDPMNAEPGNPALVPAFPGLQYDSWVTTPGVTTRMFADLPGDGQTAFGDISNDGPQNNFVFAQFTVPGGTAINFQGVVSILSTDNPGQMYDAPFSFVSPLVPEPAAVSLASMALLGLLIMRPRRSASNPAA
jgi:hypothetical protein